MKHDFEITSTGDQGPAVVLAVKGSLDAKNTMILTRRCMAIRDSGRHVVLNLAQVNLLASSGIGALLDMTEAFKEAGVSLCIVQPSTVVRSAIALLNLGAFLAVFDSDDEALGEIAA